MKVLSTEVTTASNMELFEFTQGIDVDRYLYAQEIQVQKAWAQALAQGNYLTQYEADTLISALEKVRIQMQEDSFSWRIEDEDIHMNIERALTHQLGDLGKKIHLGRSRNDLIASTLRLFVKDELTKIDTALQSLILALVTRCETWENIITPGMTHMQFGQPIRFSHLFSAHGHALQRDRQRLEQCQQECMEYLPLGSAAFAGTHIQIDLDQLSKNLGFQGPVINTYDAVSDRDYMLSSLNAFATLAMHLSRLCEDVMFWSSSGIKLLKLPYDWSTGSSIMPNKRNPDVPELVRAKMARVMTRAQEGLTLMRSVTPSYGSDIHELKRTFISAHTELWHCLEILKPFISGLEVNTQRAHELLMNGHVLATDLANQLAETMSFRDAYKIIADSIRNADELGLQIHDFMEQNGTVKKISFESSVESRSQTGGTSLRTAQKALQTLQQKASRKSP